MVMGKSTAGHCARANKVVTNSPPTILSGSSLAHQISTRIGGRRREITFAQGGAAHLSLATFGLRIRELFKVGFQFNSFCEKLVPD